MQPNAEPKPIEIANLSRELAELRDRRNVLLSALTGAAAELKRSGAPLSGQLIDDLGAYQRDVARLAALVDAAANLAEIERGLAERDPRRRALRALSNLSVEGGGELPGVEEVRTRAAAALADLDKADRSDLKALLSLHGWIASHRHGLPQPDSDAVMAHLLEAGIPTRLAISPELDRLSLGLDNGLEPTPARPAEHNGATGQRELDEPPPAGPEAPAAGPKAPTAGPKAPATGPKAPTASPKAPTTATPTPNGRAVEQPARAGAEEAGAEEADVEEPDVEEPSVEKQDRPSEEQAVAAGAHEGLMRELIASELAGIAACYEPGGTPLRQALELLALACAARSSGDACAQELARRAPQTTRRLEGEEAKAVGYAAALRCAITAPTTAVVEAIEHLKTTSVDRPSLSAIGDRALRSAQQGFELGRDCRGIDPSNLKERAAALSEEAKRWLGKPGKTNFQRGSRLWRQWADARTGRLGRMLAIVAAGDREQLEALQEQVDELRANLDRHLTADDKALRGGGGQVLQGRARRDLHRRAESILQVAVEAVETWTALGEADQDARRTNPRAAALLSDLAAALSQHLEEAQREIAASPELGLGATALCCTLEALERLVSRRESLPSGPEPAPDEALRGSLLALDVRLDEKLEPVTPLTETTGRLVLDTQGEEANWRGAFERRLKADEIHNARLIRRRLAGASSGDQETLDAQLRRRAKQLTEALERQVEHVRIEIDQNWRLGCLPHETCIRLYQELEQIEQQLADPDASLSRQLEGLSGEIKHAAKIHVREKAGYLRRQLAEIAPPDDGVRSGIERLIDNRDIASAEDAIETLRRDETPMLAERGKHLSNLSAFVKLIPELESSGFSIEAACAAVRGGEPLANLDFAAVREYGSEDAVIRALERWAALGNDGSLLKDNRQSDLREHARAVLEMAGFRIQGLRQLAKLRNAGSNVGIVELEMQLSPRWEGLAPQFGSDALVLRVALLREQGASPDELYQAARADSERACVALVPRVLSLAQRRRIAELHCKDQGGAPVLFLDTAALLYSCSHGGTRMEPTMHVTLPFTAVNPYMPFRGRQVPAEMFFGRTREASQLMSRDGYSFVYGGRRLGKSALLEEVKRRSERAEEPIKAIIIDLQDAGIAKGSPPSMLLPLLAKELGKELGVEPPSRKLEDRERLHSVVRTWLEQDPRRQLLVLLDETDEFLQADADDDFKTTSQLHALQVEFKRRFKPVFAGLHQVKRFSDVPNQRLTQHFGESMAVGPLDTTEALGLVEEPLGALGFELEQSAAHRILAATRNQPSLIQLVCHHLVRHKLSEVLPQRQPPPYLITHADIEAVLARANVASEVRERLELTLNLDSRYRIILLVVALSQLESETHRPERSGGFDDPPERPMRAGDIESECRDWSRAGFADTTEYEFDALLDEMCELGVLYRNEDGTFRPQSPTIRRLLGTEDSIIDSLDRASSMRPPERFNSSTHHEALDSSSGGARDPYRRSPLTIEQVQELCRRKSRLVVILGTRATNVNGMGETLSHSRLEQTEGEVRQTFVAVNGNRPAVATQDAFVSQLRRAGKRMHKIALIDGSGEMKITETFLRKAQNALGAGGKRPDGTVCGAIVAQAEGSLMKTLMGYAAEEHGDELGRRFLLLGLRRWEASGLRAWSHDEVDELPLGVERWREELLRVTGGWPMLVDRIVAQTRGRGTDTFVEALRELDKRLETPEGARELVQAVGLSDPESIESRVWKALLVYNEPIPLTSEIATEIGPLAGIGEDEEERARVAYETLRMMDALAIDREQRRVAPEPVLAAAWNLLYG
jgi:hypothetical protein